jgi:hypothetical protein
LTQERAVTLLLPLSAAHLKMLETIFWTKPRQIMNTMGLGVTLKAITYRLAALKPISYIPEFAAFH